MALHVFGHVKPDQLKAQLQGELFGDLGFAHSGGAREQKEPMGLSPERKPARASFIEDTSCEMALSWPKTTICRFGSSFCSSSRSSEVTVLGGIRAIFAITDSMSPAPITFFRRLLGNNCWYAPASSITSIALSRQVAVGDVTRRHFSGDPQRPVAVAQTVVVLKATL